MPWRFLYAGRLSARRLSSCRRPKTCTGPAVPRAPCERTGSTGCRRSPFSTVGAQRAGSALATAQDARNPVARVIASDAVRLLAGWYDQAKPVLDIPFDAIDPYSPQMHELVSLFGAAALAKYYKELLPRIWPKRYWKPVKLVGGLAKQKEQVPINSFGATITADFAHLFNPQSRAQRSVIARQAYISSKRRDRYIEPIDKVIRAATPPSISNSKTIDDTGNPSKPLRNARALEHKIMLLIGSAGAGKSTFVDYLQDVALHADIRAKTLWVRIDMKPAPISRDEIYPWLREEIVRGCQEANKKTISQRSNR